MAMLYQPDGEATLFLSPALSSPKDIAGTWRWSIQG